MDVVVRADRDGDRARLTPVGQFNLPHAVTAAHAIANVEKALAGCRLVELDLHVNDPAFAEAAAQTLLDMLRPADRGLPLSSRGPNP